MLRKLFFSLAYYRKPIWDTGISPPELVRFIASHEPGWALDLGCGTGTNVITLAKSGWQVTGVDFTPRAIRLAREKALQNGVEVDFLIDNVTHLKSISGSFNLILDIGCFHSLSLAEHEKYIMNIDRLLSISGTFLLYVFFKESVIPGPGVSEEDITEISKKLKLVDRLDGSERGIRSSTWLTFQK